MTRLRRILPLAAVLAVAIAPAATATHPQPPLDVNKIPYDPIGHFKPGDPLSPDYSEACNDVRPLLQGNVFNPSGKFNAFDYEVFEVSCLPWRNQDDTSATDEWGNGGGETRHGYCNGANPADPLDPGTCPNHQLEYIEFFKAQMQEILGDFGVTFQTYEFEHAEGVGRNPAAIIAGSDHPEQHILIGSHYDQTDTGPASAWDSQEGHAEMLRVAKMMADYWRATGTRPSATVKFVPMDGEEDGLLGSRDYVENTIAPEQEENVRGYFNADPCAGGYPAFHYGNRANRIPMVVQIGQSDNPRVGEWNEKVLPLVESVFDRIDDNLTTYPEQPELFVSTGEGLPGIGGDIGRHVFVDYDNPIIFGSDWQNFIAVGIPIFNPSPRVTGPSQDGSPGPQTIGTPEGIYQFHSPIDNLMTMMRYTGGSPTGEEYSEGWIKGMEFCANLLASGMLMPEMGGAQTADTKPVAYFEALPNEATVRNFVNFNGDASHQYADVATRKLVPDDDLQLKWDFGDGTPTAYGRNVKHSYRRSGTFTAKLTVTNRETNETASMELPIVVEEGTGADEDPADQFVDRVPPKKSVVACPTVAAFTKASVRPSGRGLRFDFATSDSTKPTVIEVFRATSGKSRRVARFRRTGPFTWRGKRGLRRGTYFVRMTAIASNSQREDRYFSLTRTSRFRKARPFARDTSCELLSFFRLTAPAFGRSLAIGVATTKDAAVEVRVVRGSRTVKRFRTQTQANRAARFTLSGRRLRRGVYRVIAKVTATDGSTQSATLYTRKL